MSPPCRASRRVATLVILWTLSWRRLAFLGDGGVGFGDGFCFGGDGTGVGFGDGGGVGFGGGGGVEDFFGGSEDSVDGEGDFFFFVVGAVFLEAGGLVVFFLVVEEASCQVMVTASVALCRSVWILGIPVSLVALSMPTSWKSVVFHNINIKGYSIGLIERFILCEKRCSHFESRVRNVTFYIAVTTTVT